MAPHTTHVIPMAEVASSNLAQVGYDRAARVLRVQFRSGATYDYAGVPPEVAAHLLTAPSAGGALAALVKPHYPATKLPPAGDEPETELSTQHAARSTVKGEVR